MLLQDGMSSRDGNHRLMRYWSALERLYVEPDAREGSNAKVVERCLLADPEPELTRWKLEHVARLRNEYVHAGGADDDLHDLGQFLRELVARHVNHWIFRSDGLRNHADMLAVVKLPRRVASLEEARAAIDLRLEIERRTPYATPGDAG